MWNRDDCVSQWRGALSCLIARSGALFRLACTFAPLIAYAATASAQSSLGDRGRAIDKISGQVIEYEIRPDGYALWGDIVIGKTSDIERYGLRLPQPLSPGRVGKREDRKQIQENYVGTRLWKLPIAYHVADPTFAALVGVAIADLTEKTVLRFVPRTTETDFIEFVGVPGLVFTSFGIGNNGGMHTIEIGTDFYQDLRIVRFAGVGIVQHEILHALGFAHEHQRMDRDDYIELNRECIEGDALDQYEFKFDTVPFGNYDFASVMHYGTGAFQTSPGCATFTVKPGKDATVALRNCTQYSVGQRCGVSPGDIAAINYFYSPYALEHVALNQHGLTGSWYEPATSGQGILMEIFPNLTPGAGHAFLAWFTHDTVIGGAERQRWYTLQGPVTNGQPNASLTIYENTGGNFNAPPVTESRVVGNATLSFSTCSNGALSYSFTDGSGRAGTMPLTRLLSNVTCSVTSPYRTDADFALSGSWYGGAATSGQGFVVDIASGTLFLGWFTYMPNGVNAGIAGQRWYSAQGPFARGMRTIPVQIYETTGGKFDTPKPPGQHTVEVGTGTMAFQSCSAATFSYSFTGGTSAGSSGTISLSRIGPVPPGCAQ